MPYSDLSLPKQKLCHRLDYHHQIDTYQSNPQSQTYCQKFKNSLFRIRQLRSKSLTKTAKQQDYNKYYIKPELRYKKKTQDPKRNIIKNAQQSYFYDNLHNRQFWQWKHPFQKKLLLQQKKSIQDKVNQKILQKFKQHIQTNTHCRLPMVVRSVLDQKL